MFFKGPRYYGQITVINKFTVFPKMNTHLEISAHPQMSAYQKQWVFKGGEYTKPMGFDGWFSKGGSTQNQWALDFFYCFNFLMSSSLMSALRKCAFFAVVFGHTRCNFEIWKVRKSQQKMAPRSNPLTNSLNMQMNIMSAVASSPTGSFFSFPTIVLPHAIPSIPLSTFAHYFVQF